MADTDLLPSRGITFEALVDSTGVAINGTSTVAQLAAKGMRAACAVDGTGTAITGGGSLAQIAAAGIRAFCAVDQNGVAQDASTADQLCAAAASGQGCCWTAHWRGAGRWLFRPGFAGVALESFAIVLPGRRKAATRPRWAR